MRSVSAVGVYRNPGCETGPYPDDLRALLGPEAMDAARRTISSWRGYAATPLVSLAHLAQRVGVASIDYKDEAERFGLGSFKALGGAYAVFRLIQRLARDRLGRDIDTWADLSAPAIRALTGQVTVCCATDGNHGRSVAWAAREFGCRCVIFLHAGVSEGRQRAIEAYGAKIERVPGNYDASVEAAARTAASNGWFVISDTSCAGYTEAPLQVMAGYTAMIAELLEQIARPPTHVFVQGGVGGLAAAAAAALWLALGEQRPQIVVVEPEAADCLYQSARAGHPVRVEGELNTVMAGLACGEVSLVAWTILERAVSHFVTLPDVAAITVMRGLAHGAFGDAPLVAGESAVAGVAVLTAAGPRPELARTLGLTAESRVLCFGTEGDTDPEIFRRITGLSAAEVRAAAAA